MVSNMLGRAYRKTIAAMDSSNTPPSVRDLFSGEKETPHSVPALWMATEIHCVIALCSENIRMKKTCHFSTSPGGSEGRNDASKAPNSAMA